MVAAAKHQYQDLYAALLTAVVAAPIIEAAPILAALRRGAGPRPFLPQMHFASGWARTPFAPVCLLAVSLMRTAFPFML